MPHLTVNGSDVHTPAATLAELLVELNLADKPVAAERNGVVVPRRDHADTRLWDQDTLELVTLVGGG